MLRPRPAAYIAPRALLLSNGSYTLAINGAGSGFSRWRDVAVTRWREDPTRDAFGSYVFLRDRKTWAVWSAGVQACGRKPQTATANLAGARAELGRRDGTIVTTMEVAVAPDLDAEVRRVTIANHGKSTREIDVTSYAELVLGSAAADAAHPAFSKMFVQTEWVGQPGILLATRRKRSPDERDVWAAHLAVLDGSDAAIHEHETDRARFLGRGRVLRNAAAMERRVTLSNTVGTVLDPIFSLRRRVLIAPGGTAQIALWTSLARSRDELLTNCKRLFAADACERAFAGALDYENAERTRLGIDALQAERFQRLVAPLLDADRRWRSPPEILERGAGGAPVLWVRGISGDRPIVLVRIAEEANLENVHELLVAQRYWQSKRLGVDIVMLNTAPERRADALHETLNALANAQRSHLTTDTDVVHAEIFALRDDEIGAALRDGVATAARIVVDAASGRLDAGAARSDPAESQTADAPWAPVVTPASLAAAVPPRASAPAPALASSLEPLEFDNGIGGFAQSGREYCIRLAGGRCTPMPWINVIANASFGFTVSAEGGGYTWSLNSQQNPLTPWPNDPVSDTPHEALYVRDEDSGELWSAAALPIRVASTVYSACHGKGYSRFAHDAHGIELELLQWVPADDSIKLSRLRLRNRSGRTRRLSVTGYVEWALGANGTVPAPYVVTAIDATTASIFARNAWRPEFGERVAFADLRGTQTSWTADRTAFLGINGGADRPAALLSAAPLSARAGAGLDPCAALQTRVELAPDAATDVVFMLGDAASPAQAQALVAKYRAADLDRSLDEVRNVWNDVLDTVQVRTPDRALDILLNDWLLYQTLGCRVWARTACYQSSGAYGFRDQLQDVMALCVARPDIAREHLLRAAARQFIQGDVQHWWLPPAGRGIRTRMTDDRVWLPYVAAHYIDVTGDAAVLDAEIPFLDGDMLKDDELEAFFTPSVAPDAASLYEHCARALDASLTLGAHGLPLMGTGDWNDGMNRVGAGGRGESVWLAWFLIAAIDAFAPYAQARNDSGRVTQWRNCASAVGAALESAGWDGQWYRRGYYDDGTPLGSSSSTECRIDTIAQSWSVIAGAGDPARATRAMAAMDEHLIRRDDRIALLLAPPFDRSPLDPGYIKGYPPGIRENGGQYTHGAIWSIFALARLGQGDRAAELFAILNPIRHASTPDDVARYQVEPYAACADVYSVPPHVGRGGWTWYTGSAGWLYRAGLEAILGFRLHGNALALDPCVPAAWTRCEIVYRRRGPRDIVTRYEVAIENPNGVHRGIVRLELDGEPIAGDAALIPLADDGRLHRVRVVLG